MVFDFRQIGFLDHWFHRTKPSWITNIFTITSFVIIYSGASPWRINIYMNTFHLIDATLKISFIYNSFMMHIRNYSTIKHELGMILMNTEKKVSFLLVLLINEKNRWRRGTSNFSLEGSSSTASRARLLQYIIHVHKWNNINALYFHSSYFRMSFFSLGISAKIGTYVHHSFI